MLSCFSRVQLCATLETAAHQAPPCLGFSRQEQWSGLGRGSALPRLGAELELRRSAMTVGFPELRRQCGVSHEI